MDLPTEYGQRGYSYRDARQYRSVPRPRMPPVYQDPATVHYSTRRRHERVRRSHFEEYPQPTKVPAAKATVTVLKMPYNHDVVEHIPLELIVTDEKAFADNQCTRREYLLGHIPDVWRKDVKSFEYKDRSLVKIAAAQVHPECKVDYYMYKCVDEGVGLKPNQWFWETPDACVYGDAFVFKADGLDGNTSLADYVDMDDYYKEKLGAAKAFSTLAKL